MRSELLAPERQKHQQHIHYKRIENTVIIFSAHNIQHVSTAVAWCNIFLYRKWVSEFCFSPSLHIRTTRTNAASSALRLLFVWLCFCFFAVFCCKCSIGCAPRLLSVSPSPFAVGEREQQGSTHTLTMDARVCLEGIVKKDKYICVKRAQRVFALATTLFRGGCCCCCWRSH